HHQDHRAAPGHSILRSPPRRAHADRRAAHWDDAHGGPTVEAGGPDRGDARAISRAGDTRRRPRATRRVCARNFSLHLRTAPRYHGEDPDVLEPGGAEWP